MNYFTRIGDRMVIRLINRGILLHAFLCITAIGMTIAAPFVICDLAGDIMLTGRIMREAQVVSAPLVNRAEERGDAQTGKFLYYLAMPGSGFTVADRTFGIATPYLRSSKVGELDRLQIFSHPELTGPSNPRPRVVEVPNDLTWTSVFKALRGRSIGSAMVIFMLQSVLAFVVIYVAIRGYFFVKYGTRRR